jgi:hypothetical protein
MVLALLFVVLALIGVPFPSLALAVLCLVADRVVNR